MQPSSTLPVSALNVSAPNVRRFVAVALASLSVWGFAPQVRAQAAKPQPDVVVFANGERLTGELETANAGGIVFKSAMAGEVKVGWANVVELQSSKHFAVLDSRVKLKRRTAESMTPQGTIAVDTKAKTVEVATANGPKTVPIANVNNLLDPAAFDKAVNHPPNFFHGFGGTANVGASFVRATQNSTTFNGGLSLVRVSPGVDWLPPNNRTLLTFNQAYGTTSQVGTTSVETNILHGAVEQDEYLSPRLFAFASAAFDHNFAQQLQLQQAYGGGLGVTVLKSAKQELDFKGNVQYVKQSFFVTPLNPVLSPSQNIVGSLFSDTYMRHLTKTIVFNEFASLSPAFNIPADYSAHANASLGFPVYHGLAFTVGAVDDYLNNAPVGSKRNSVQFLTGIAYTIK